MRSECDALPARRRQRQHISVTSSFKRNVHSTIFISRQCVPICCEVEHVADLHATRKRMAVRGKQRQRWDTHLIFSHVFGQDAPEQRFVLFAIKSLCCNPRLAFEFFEGQRVQREQLVLQLLHVHSTQRGIVGLNLRALPSHVTSQCLMITRAAESSTSGVSKVFSI